MTALQAEETSRAEVEAKILAGDADAVEELTATINELTCQIEDNARKSTEASKQAGAVEHGLYEGSKQSHGTHYGDFKANC